MPKDTPPPNAPHPRSEREQPVPQRPRTPPKPKKDKTPDPEIPKQGPSATIEEAFLRAGASTIEAAPVIRDFHKEAVAFVPSAVKRRPLPPPKPTTKIDLTEPLMEKEVKRSFATTVEDVKDEEDQGSPAPVPATAKDPPSTVGHEKRARGVEPEAKPQQLEPPPRAPSKRRRLVNAAPDV